MTSTRVLNEQLRIFFGQTKDAIFGHLVVGIGVFVLLHNHAINHSLLYAWGVLLVAVAGARIAIYHRFPKAPGPEFQPQRWARRFRMISYASGGTFGLLPILFLDNEHFVVTAWILLIMAGLAGGALGTLSSYAPAFRAYIMSATLPLVSVLMVHLDLELTVIAVLFAIMALYFDRFARRFESELVQEIEARLDKADLANRLSVQGEALRSVMRSIPNAIAVVDPEGQFLYTNDKFRSLFAVPDGLLDAGMNHTAFNTFRSERGDFDHLDAEAFRQQRDNWDRLWRSTEAFDYERTLRSGRVLRVENHPMQEGGWVRSWIDITERKQAEEERLRKSEQLQLTLDNIDQGLSVVDRHGNQVMANRRYCEMLGLPEEMASRTVPLTEVVAQLNELGELGGMSPDLVAFMDRWEAGLDPTPRVVYERQQASGNWLLVMCRRLPDGGHVRTFTDITERKQAERTAEVRRELLEFTLENIEQGVVMRDAEDNILLYNNRLSELLDVPAEMYAANASSEEMSAFHDRQGVLADAEARTKTQEWFRARKAGEPVERLEYQRPGPNGRWIHVVYQPLPQGREIRTFSDISSIKAYEHELQDQTRFLETVLGEMEQGVLVTDADHRLAIWNRRACEILGVPAAVMRTRPDFEQLAEAQRAAGDLVRDDPDIQAYLDAWYAWIATADSSEIFSYERRLPHDRWMLVFGRKLEGGGVVRTLTDITTQKRNEVDLLKATEEADLAQRRLRAAIDAMPAGVLVHNDDISIQTWNAAYRRLTGFSEEQLENSGRFEDLAELIRADIEARTDVTSLEDYVAKRNAMYHRDRPAMVTEHWRSNDVFVEIQVNPIPTGGWVTVFVDVTERMRAIREAEETRERMRAIVQSLPVGVVVLDRDKRIDFWNDAYSRFTGLSDADLDRNRRFEDAARFIYDNYENYRTVPFSEFLENRLRIYEDTAESMREVNFQDPRYDVQYIVAPLPDGGRLNVLVDITEQKDAERRAIEARDGAEALHAGMRAILQSIPVGVLVYNPDQYVEFWNEAYCQITGFPAGVLEERPHFIDYSHYIFKAHNRGKDMSLEKFMEYRNGVYLSDEEYSREFHFDATGLDVQYIVQKLPDGGRINVIVDITPQKQAERNALDARDIAEEATRAKSAFLAAMSHEIRTPMNGVIGMAEILQQSRLDDDQRSIVSTIRDSGQILLRIIDDVLDFSKIEAGRLELEQEVIDIRALLESVLETLAPGAEAKDLDLATRITPSTPTSIIGDPVRLRQILLNLTGNAVKFTETGSVQIATSATPDTVDPSRLRLRLEVVDTGIGIQQERVSQLFEPFRQAEADTTRRFGGTGLGLSISQRLVSLMGGEIGVSSRIGEGSTFWVEIPVEPGSMEIEAPFETMDLSAVEIAFITRPGPLADWIEDHVTRLGASLKRLRIAEAGAARAAFDVVMIDGRLGKKPLLDAASEQDFDESSPNARGLWIFNGRAEPLHAMSLPRPPKRDALLHAVAVMIGKASAEMPALLHQARDGDGRNRIPSVDQALIDGKLILVVEDNATNRMVVKRQLALLGLAVETAVDGQEALEMWRERAYGLILTDCHMPIMDGYQLTYAIRDAERSLGRHTPIIALTANAMAGEAERCLAAGMDDYLSKPATLDQMSRALIKWLSPAARRSGARDEIALVETASAPPSTNDPANDPGELPVIDLVMLERILGTADPEFVNAMLDLFRSSYLELSVRMEAAVEARDAQELREASHAAKGASANAGAEPLRAALEAVEMSARAADWQAIDSTMSVVRDRAKILLERIESGTFG